MLFLKVYPGRENPFFLSIGSLKITSCSKRKTRRSFARDRKLLSCSMTVKVSCWSSFPRAVIFPWNPDRNKHGRPGRGYAKTTRRSGGVCDSNSRHYLKALQPAHIHHVVAAFRNKTHHLHRLLLGKQKAGFSQDGFEKSKDDFFVLFCFCFGTWAPTSNSSVSIPAFV